jgi:predicted DNA-binding protein with PD1-like motif
MQFHPLGDGRYVMRLDPGDELIASLRQFAAEEEVLSGHLTGIGSTSNAQLGWLDPETGEYVKRRFDEPMEVANLTGTFSVAEEDGRAFVHVHGVFAPQELISYSGHVHEARTGAVMEIFLTTFNVRLERASVPDKSFPWLFMPREERPDETESGRTDPGQDDGGK